MKKLLHWIMSVAGYGTYTLAVLFFLLWYLFPADSVRVWLQNQLENRTPALNWEISKLHLALPFSVVAESVRAGDRKTDKVLVVVDEVKIHPEFKNIAKLSENLPAAYTVRSFGGSIVGSFSLVRNEGLVNCSGEIRDVQVGELEEVWKRIGRNVTGSVAGSFDYVGNIKDPLSGQLKAELVFANGTVDLLQPIMGLEKLEYNQLKTSLSSADRTATLEDGRLDSDLFAVDFKGSVNLADNLLMSTLDIQGSFEPRPELLGSLKDAAVVQLIRNQLKDDKLSFTLTDTLLEPGITFQGVSGVIDGVIQGSVR